MSLMRLNYLLMSDVLPFNFGMDYQSWLRLWNEHPDMRGSLVPTDPATWTPETIEAVNKNAKEETELCDRLMALDKDAFYAEVERLRNERSDDSEEHA